MKHLFKCNDGDRIIYKSVVTWRGKLSIIELQMKSLIS